MTRWIPVEEEPLPRDEEVMIRFHSEMIRFDSDKARQQPVRYGYAIAAKETDKHPDTVTVRGHIIGGGQRILNVHISYIDLWEKITVDPPVSRFDLLDL